MNNERKILQNESSFLHREFYVHHGLEFQELFNKLMIELDNEFHPIKQKHDHGNDGYSPKLKTQFACYSPEKDNTDKSIIKKVKDDWESFVKHLKEDPSRLTGVENFTFVINLDVIADPVSNFIKNCILTNIKVTVWHRSHLIDKAESLNDEQLAKFLNIKESEINENNKITLISEKLEITLIKYTFTEMNKSSSKIALNYIESLLQSHSFSNKIKSFCKEKKVTALTNLYRFDEAEQYLEIIQGDIETEKYILLKTYLLYFSNQFEKLTKLVKEHMSNFINNTDFVFYIAYTLTEDELEEYSYDIKNSIQYKLGLYCNYMMNNKRELAYTLAEKLIESNKDTNIIGVYQVYIYSLLPKYFTITSDIVLTEKEKELILHIKSRDIGDEILQAKVLFLLGKHDEIIITSENVRNNQLDEYYIYIAFLTYYNNKNIIEMAKILDFYINEINYIILSNLCILLEHIKEEELGKEIEEKYIKIIELTENEEIDEKTILQFIPIYLKCKRYELIYNKLKKYSFTDKKSFFISLKCY